MFHNRKRTSSGIREMVIESDDIELNGPPDGGYAPKTGIRSTSFSGSITMAIESDDIELNTPNDEYDPHTEQGSSVIPRPRGNKNSRENILVRFLRKKILNKLDKLFFTNPSAVPESYKKHFYLNIARGFNQEDITNQIKKHISKIIEQDKILGESPTPHHDSYGKVKQLDSVLPIMLILEIAIHKLENDPESEKESFAMAKAVITILKIVQAIYNLRKKDKILSI